MVTCLSMDTKYWLWILLSTYQTWQQATGSPNLKCPFQSACSIWHYHILMLKRQYYICKNKIPTQFRQKEPQCEHKPMITQTLCILPLSHLFIWDVVPHCQLKQMCQGIEQLQPLMQSPGVAVITATRQLPSTQTINHPVTKLHTIQWGSGFCLKNNVFWTKAWSITIQC